MASGFTEKKIQYGQVGAMQRNNTSYESVTSTSVETNILYNNVSVKWDIKRNVLSALMRMADTVKRKHSSTNLRCEQMS